MKQIALLTFAVALAGCVGEDLKLTLRSACK